MIFLPLDIEYDF